MEAHTTVVLADTHVMVREGLKLVLERTGRIRVVGEAGSAEEAVRLARARQPHIVALCPEAIGHEGTVQSIRKLGGLDPEPKVLVLSPTEPWESAPRVIEAGAAGCIGRTRSGADLVAAIDLLAAGRTCFAHRDLRLVEQGHRNGESQYGAKLKRLNDTEGRILELAARGFTSNQIGRRIQLAPKSVDNGRARVRRKLGLRNRAELVAFALNAGLLRPDA